MTTVGIDSIAVQIPESYLDIEVLAQARNVPPDKYIRGLGVRRMAVAEPHEDPVALAAGAARKLLSRPEYADRLGRIGLCLTATETAVDQSKAIPLFLSPLIGLPPDCRMHEVKCACYGGTAALQSAMEWLASGAGRGRLALVICTDIARYAPGSPAEPTQGAGAVAMIVSERPRLLEIELGQGGLQAADRHGFCRPNGLSYPIVDGKISVNDYLEALGSAFTRWRAGHRSTALAAYCYHTPFPAMAMKAHRYRLTADGSEESGRQQNLEDQVRPSLTLAREIGNIYTGSLYLALASLLHGQAERLAGRMVGLFSYGSGDMTEYFAGRVMPDADQLMVSLRVTEILDNRKALTMTEYEDLRKLDAKIDRLPAGSFPVPENGVSFLGITDGQRQYAIGKP